MIFVTTKKKKKIRFFNSYLIEHIQYECIVSSLSSLPDPFSAHRETYFKKRDKQRRTIKCWAPFNFFLLHYGNILQTCAGVVKFLKTFHLCVVS